MDETKAVTTVQAYVRGFLARKLYTRELLGQIEQEEAEMREREQLQLAEGELLVERYRLQQEVQDCHTLASNHTRRLNVMATRLQRAWRAKTGQQQESSYPKSEHDTYGDSSPGATFSSSPTSTVPENDESASGVIDDLARQVQTVLPVFGSQFDADMDDMYEYPEGMSGIPPRTEYTTEKLTLARGLSNPFRSSSVTHSLAPAFRKVATLHLRDEERSPSKRTFSEDRYRLLYSVELSDSSEDEGDAMVEQNSLDGATDVVDFKWDETPLENGHEPRVAQLAPRHIEEPHLDMEFSDENGLMPGLADSLRTERSNMEFIDRNELDPRVGQVHIASRQDENQKLDMEYFEEEEERTAKETPLTVHHTGATQTLMDHSVNPLHGLDALQLRRLSWSLEKKVLAMSTSLVKLLEERDALTMDGELLKDNIGNLARTVQRLYPGE